MTDRLRAQVTINGATVWPDVLLAAHMADGPRVDVWGRASQYPGTGTPHHARPEFVLLARLDGATIQAMPRKGRQRLIVHGDVTYTVDVLRNCCSAWSASFHP